MGATKFGKGSHQVVVPTHWRDFAEAVRNCDMRTFALEEDRSQAKVVGIRILAEGSAVGTRTYHAHAMEEVGRSERWER